MHDQICRKCYPRPLEQRHSGRVMYTDSTKLNLYLIRHEFFSLSRRLSLPRSLHFSLALPVNPRWDLAHTHWNSLQPKVGQKPSEDRAQRETEGETERGREVGTGGWGEMTESNWQGTQRRTWFFIICTYKSYFSFHLRPFLCNSSLRLHNTFRFFVVNRLQSNLFFFRVDRCSISLIVAF